VEVDAEYIKGMINNPDLIPNATLNRWIAVIRLFDFTLKHVPADKHRGPDGLSRREGTAEENCVDWQEPIEDWLEEKLEHFYCQPTSLAVLSTEEEQPPAKLRDQFTIPLAEKSKIEYQDIAHIKKFLTDLRFSNELTSENKDLLARKVSKFFLRNGKLYKRHDQNRHQRVIDEPERIKILHEIHDKLGHKGFLPNRSTLYARFWWPGAMEDLKWYLKTCQTCQERNTAMFHIPPTVPEPASLFGRMHIDTFYMPKHHGFKYVVHAVCSLSGWSEAKAMRKENANTIGDFIFNDILCRFGAIHEIVTDNGSPFIKAVEYLSDKYHINHIKISPYNSQAQGIIERAHYGLREALIRTCGKRIQDWPLTLPYCLWAQRITTKKGIGYSPYYMAFGVEPTFPFDITEATYLAPNFGQLVDTPTLIAIRARQLEKRSGDLQQMKEQLWKRRRIIAGDFEVRNKSTIRNFEFEPGSLVLVRNSAEDTGLKNKYRPRYLGPYVVARRNQGGAYMLSEMDGTLSALRFAAKRLIPYHLRSLIELPHPNEALDRVNDRIPEE
jgi:transposase InsO family protein